MNLGNFAGGLAQGAQTQQRINLQADEAASNKDFRERGMKMQEQDQAAQEQKRQSDTAMRNDSAALFKKYFGDKTVQIGETESQGPDGQKIKTPIMKTTSSPPGADPEATEQWANEHALLAAKHGGMSLDDMQKIAGFVDTGRRTRAGKALDKVLAGDKTALAEFLTAQGKPPEGATLNRDLVKGINEIVPASGEKVDLKRAAAATATAAYYKQLVDEEDRAQKTSHNLAQTADIAAQGKLRDAQATVIPSEIRKNDASAAHSYASAAAAGEGKKTAAQERELKTVAGILDKNYPSSKDPSGEMKVHPARTFVEQAVLAAAPGSERSTAASSMKFVDRVSAEAKQRVQALQPDAKKQILRKIGGMSDSDIVNAYIAGGLNGKQQ